MIRSLGYPLLLHGAFLGILFVLLIVFAWQRATPFLILSTFFLLLGAASWLWSRRCMQGVSFRAAPSQSRVFPDEPIEIVFEVNNEKVLPLQWLEIELALPWRLATGGLKSPSPFSRERLRWTTAISANQRLSWRHGLTCRGRGEHRLGPARLRSGDMFGLFPVEMVLPLSESILVYPRIAPLEKLNPGFKTVIGEFGARRSLYEDLNRPMGPRDYHHQDPFNRIHWKATARQGRLQVRQFESLTGLNLLLALDVQGYRDPENPNEEAFETAVVVAASLACECLRAGWPTGLVAGSSPAIRIGASTHPDQYLFMLEALAKVQWGCGPSLRDLFAGDRSILAPRTTLFIITHLPSPELIGLLRDLKRNGFSLCLATTGDWPPGACPDGVPTLTIPYSWGTPTLRSAAA